jgi:putative hydrolase of the HAD superfamily
VGAFDRIFASHELGLRKPERAAFERVCALTGTSAASILFFDDLAENVQAAKDAGFQGVLVKTPEDVAAALRSFGHAATR